MIPLAPPATDRHEVMPVTALCLERDVQSPCFT